MYLLLYQQLEKKWLNLSLESSFCSFYMKVFSSFKHIRAVFCKHLKPKNIISSDHCPNPLLYKRNYITHSTMRSLYNTKHLLKTSLWSFPVLNKLGMLHLNVVWSIRGTTESCPHQEHQRPRCPECLHDRFSGLVFSFYGD